MRNVMRVWALCGLLMLTLVGCAFQHADSASETQEPLTEETETVAPAESTVEGGIESILAGVGYFGERSACQITPAMAQAYRDQLGGMGSIGMVPGGEGGLKSMLLDVSGDGLPLLATVYASSADEEGMSKMNPIQVWEYRDGVVQEIQPTFTTAAGYTGLWIGNYGGIHTLRFYDGAGTEIGDCTGWIAYEVNQGMATPVHTVMMYSGFSEDGEKMSYRDAEGNEQEVSVSELEAQGWVIHQDDFGAYSGYAYYLDGVLNYDGVEDIQAYSKNTMIGYWGDIPMLDNGFSDREAMIVALSRLMEGQ